MARPDHARRYLMPAITGYEPWSRCRGRRTAAWTGWPGGGYNLIGVNVAATYRGQVDVVACAKRDKDLLCRLEALEYRSAILTHGKTRLFAGRGRALR